MEETQLLEQLFEDWSNRIYKIPKRECYSIQHCLQNTELVNNYTILRFREKLSQDSIAPGITDMDLCLILLHRFKDDYTEVGDKVFDLICQLIATLNNEELKNG